MRYFSTSSRSISVSAREAVLAGLAPDGGLFMPEKVLPFDAAAQREADFADLSARMLSPYFDDVLPADFQKIVHSAFDFPVPLKEIEPGIFALELFHGPTLAFKDFGARMLARLMAFYRRSASRELNVLVATSGDTGSAVADGFFKVPGIRVVLLYPKGKVSRIQEQQLTTLGENITALEVDGTFDDCQRLVKEAFLDKELRAARDLTSANSINIGRLLPQACYYVYAWCRLPEDGRKKLIVSVPSGNLGNLAAGVLAREMGLPVSRFVAALNRNDVFGEYLASARFEPRPSVLTLSNAMDVGNPSNIARLIDIMGADNAKMRLAIDAYSFSDEVTVKEIGEVRRRYKYLLDPHGAVGLLGLRRALSNENDARGIFLATAHPAKFVETVERATGEKVELPEALKSCLAKQKSAKAIPASYEALRAALAQ